MHEVAQPTTASEIVVATHGRSVWVLDVNSIRQMSERTERIGNADKKIDPLKDAVTLFAPAPATRWKIEGGASSRTRGTCASSTAPTRTLGASLDYMLTKPAKAVSLKVTDVNGTLVRDFRTPPAEAGFHSLQWNLSSQGRRPVRVVGAAGRGGRGGGGAAVPAGGYRVTLTVDGKDYTQALVVENDPKADPKAIISFDVPISGGEENEEDEEVREREAMWREIIPFIPKAKD